MCWRGKEDAGEVHLRPATRRHRRGVTSACALTCDAANSHVAYETARQTDGQTDVVSPPSSPYRGYSHTGWLSAQHMGRVMVFLMKPRRSTSNKRELPQRAASLPSSACEDLRLPWFPGQHLRASSLDSRLGFHTRITGRRESYFSTVSHFCLLDLGKAVEICRHNTH